MTRPWRRGSLAWLRARRPAGSADAMGRFRWVAANAVGRRPAAHGCPGTAGHRHRRGRPDLPARACAGAAGLGGPSGRGGRRLDAVDGGRRPHPLTRWAGSTQSTSPGGRSGSATGGRVPQIGQRIRVAGYRYGGGTAGNVAAGAISALTGTAGVKVTERAAGHRRRRPGLARRCAGPGAGRGAPPGPGRHRRRFPRARPGGSRRDARRGDPAAAPGYPDPAGRGRRQPRRLPRPRRPRPRGTASGPGPAAPGVGLPAAAPAAHD